MSFTEQTVPPAAALPRPSRPESRISVAIEHDEPRWPGSGEGLRIPGSPQPGMAWADGGPLVIPETAPTTLTEALQRTAKVSPEHGLQLYQTEGTPLFLSYPELLRQAKCLLGGLRAQGLKPGDRAILQLERLADHFPAFWACVLGGIIPVTVAIAPSYREKNGVVNKLFNIWELLEHPVILTNASLQPALNELPRVMPMAGLRVLSVETLRAQVPDEEIHPARPEDVIFYQLTSGSTGIPKCIQETHHGIIAHIHGSQQFNGYAPENVTFNWLPMDHVVPILTIHLKDVYLGCNQVHARTDLVLSKPLRWLDWMEAHGATHTWCPNFGFKLVGEELARHPERRWNLRSLQKLMNAGEQVTVPVVRDFLEQASRCGIKVESMQPAFGMAEACTCMTYTNDFSLETGAKRFEKSSLGGVLKPSQAQDGSTIEFVDLGPPVPGVEIRITDPQNRLVQERVIGRFQIRGTVITPGYLKNDPANRDAFVGDGWFNTGDIGFIADGRLFLTGREKEMIIVRGANFYCYEIEDVVNRVAGVEPTCAAACGIADPATGTEGLAIFFVPQDGKQRAPLARTIRARVTAELGISPAWVVPLERAHFPKTTSGKIQRTQMKKGLESGAYAELLAAVEAESSNQSQEPQEAPKGERELAVAAIWSEVLGIARPGRRQNFFELGGDSLKAIQVLSRIRERLEVELPLRSLFEQASTIAGMAESMQAAAIPSNADPAIEAKPGTAARPLSYPQQRVWLAEQVQPGTSLYHVCRLVRVEGAIDARLIERSLNLITARHEVLRTTFQFSQGAPVQQVNPVVDRSLALTDLSNESDPEAALQSAAAQQARQPFDLSQGPLWRAQLYRLGAEQHALLVIFHQTVVDGGSMQLFFHELSSAYQSLQAAKEPQLPALKVQYGDFSEWQRQVFQGQRLEKPMAYWREKLAQSAPRLNLPTALREGRVAGPSGESFSVTLPARLTKRLKQFNRQQGTTLFMSLLTLFKAILAQSARQQDILVGSPVTGRQRLETEKLIGFFVDTVVLRTRIDLQQSFLQNLGRVRETALGAFAHAEAPFEKLVEELLPSRSRAQSPFFQVWFGFIDTMPVFSLGSARAEVSAIDPGAAQFDLSLFVIDKETEVVCQFEYRTDLFSRATVESLAGRFQQLLARVLEHPDQPLQSHFQFLEEQESRARSSQLETSRAALGQSLKTVRRKSVVIKPT